MRLAALIAVLLLFALPAYADESNCLPNCAVTVTTTSGNCLTTNIGRGYLSLDASAATANIGYCTGDACTAVIGSAGTTTLAAGTIHYWTNNSSPPDRMCFIAASGSQPLTIREGRK